MFLHHPKKVIASAWKTMYTLGEIEDDWEDDGGDQSEDGGEDDAMEYTNINSNSNVYNNNNFGEGRVLKTRRMKSVLPDLTMITRKRGSRVVVPVDEEEKIPSKRILNVKEGGSKLRKMVVVNYFFGNILTFSYC
jgi:hypothetical protein